MKLYNDFRILNLSMARYLLTKPESQYDILCVMTLWFLVCRFLDYHKFIMMLR